MPLRHYLRQALELGRSQNADAKNLFTLTCVKGWLNRSLEH
jgi:hypothetical protein